jgi:hypothetical protein
MKKIRIIRDEEEMARFLRWADQFSLDKPIKITVEHYKKLHSQSQRGLYRVWLQHIADETGDLDVDDLHEVFKQKFLEPEEKEILGEKTLVYSTRKLSTVEYSNFMNKVEVFANDFLNMTLPQPERSEAGWS